MRRLRHHNKISLALFANAAALVLVALAIFSKNESRFPSIIPAAYGQNGQAAIGGGAGVFVVPAQFGTNFFGCYIMDIDAQTIAAYQMFPGEHQFKLIAARTFRNDRRLNNYNTSPDPNEIKKLVEKEQAAVRGADVEKRPAQPEGNDRDKQFTLSLQPGAFIMMAKMFYTLDEAKAALGKNEEEIKQLAREGRLREFRDGPRLMFKADQVETLKSEMGGGGSGGMRDQVDLGVSDTGAPIGLVDTGRGNTGSGISLVDSDMGSRVPTGSVGGLKDDTALAADLGLSGSMGGVPSPGRPGSTQTGLAGSRAGVNVLGESEYNADPGAQTAINASVSDQVNLEGIGSGSGLLDLTRESDDTSLGAELLDEIAPGGSRRGSSMGDAAGTAAGGTAGGTAIAAAPVSSRRGTGTVIQVEAADPVANALGAACLGAVVMVLLAAVALFSAVLGTRPPLLNAGFLQSFFVLVGIGAGLSLVFFVFGLLLAKRA